MPRPRSRVKYTPNTNPAYKKTIPGSTKTIQDNRPKTSAKLKKVDYQQHMIETSGKQSFKNQPSPVGYRAGDKQVAPSRVLTSAPPSSRTNVQKRIDRPVPSFSNIQPMSQTDFQFMGKLAENLKSNNPELSSRFGEIITGQKQGRLLTKVEYDLMLATSRKISDGDVSRQLFSIAEKRRQQMYTDQ